MPCFNVSTNVGLEGIDTSSILSEATTIIAKITGKSEDHIMVVLKGSVPMSCGKTEHPTAYAELVSVGGLNPENNKKLSASLAELLETKLDVPRSRFFLKIYDSPGHCFGYNGDTLHFLDGSA
ncbi:OLC1v1030529C1 [Oldenlandia corymbosa var. corymbosa]|uniref:OLC1v1030529C1 n=1 Tax=Oldenlandia corymbosa var. corymbosa TaxID=529605 RepID=A0AAV1CJV9_OLDCO|nr:OLC1v1030529C1 [Oldenlandia corymbosa var. corymbosa]